MEIKKLSGSDSSDLLNLLLKLDTETKFMMLEPGERSASLEDTQNRLTDIDESQSAFLGAYDSENLVGYTCFWRGEANRIKHSAYIVMGVLSSHTGQGIGKSLINEIEKWAKKYNVTRLELTVMVHNTNAIKLYEKMGFIKEGVKKNSLFIDGNYVDEYYMGKILCE